MTGLVEILLGRKEITIASSRSISDCLGSLRILNRPGHAYQRVDTIASLSQLAANQYTIQVSKRRRFFAVSSGFAAFGVMTSVRFTGQLEADANGKAVLRGQVEFREWYYIGIAVAVLAMLIWSIAYPAYSLVAIVFLVFILGLANWFVRSDRDNLLREVEYAVT